MVEQVLDDISFTAVTGGFSLIQVDADKKVINDVNAQYTFTMRSQNTFNENAIMKITLPTQI